MSSSPQLQRKIGMTGPKLPKDPRCIRTFKQRSTNIGAVIYGCRYQNTLGDPENVKSSLVPLIELRLTSMYWSSSQLVPRCRSVVKTEGSYIQAWGFPDDSWIVEVWGGHWPCHNWGSLNQISGHSLYHTPGTMLSSFCSLSILIFTIILCGRCYYCYSFINKFFYLKLQKVM